MIIRWLPFDHTLEIHDLNNTWQRSLTLLYWSTEYQNTIYRYNLLLFLNFTLFFSSFFFLPISLTSPKTQAPSRASPKKLSVKPWRRWTEGTQNFWRKIRSFKNIFPLKMYSVVEVRPGGTLEWTLGRGVNRVLQTLTHFAWYHTCRPRTAYVNTGLLLKPFSRLPVQIDTLVKALKVELSVAHTRFGQ